jgi:DNA (cytosine-5)-methyltransferase 1
MRQHIAYIKLGENRGLKRLWLQGQRLIDSNIHAGRPVSIIADEKAQTVTITMSADGDRIVASRKKSGSVQPIIDVENQTITKMYRNISKLKAVFSDGKIVITVHPDEAAKKERLERLSNKLKKGISLSAGSVAHGGGILDNAIHQGLADKGLSLQLDFAIEIERSYLDTSIKNNSVWSDRGLAIHAPIEDVEVSELPTVDFLLAGLPCTGASKSGRSKNKLLYAEDHQSAGNLFFAFLAICQAVNASVIVLENVPEYASTAGMSVIRATLEQWGYELHESIMNGNEMGALENRNRLVVVAVTKGLSIDIENLVAIKEKPATISEILDDTLLSDPSWKEYRHLIEKEKKDKRAGKGFAMQILDSDAEKCPVLGKGYGKVRGTEPKLRHPLNTKLMRQFTVIEHAKLKDIPEKLIAGCSATIAHEILGQSVIFPVFQAVGRAISDCLKKWVETLSSPTLPVGQMSIWDIAA